MSILTATLKHLGVLAVKRGAQRLITGHAPPPPATKGLLESTTVQGVAATAFSGAIGSGLAGVVVLGARWLGYEIDLAAAQEIATQLTAIAGAVWAIRGRLKASRRIGA